MGGPKRQTLIGLTPNGYCNTGAGQVFGGGDANCFSEAPGFPLLEPNRHTGTSSGNKQAATTWAKGRCSRVEADGEEGRGLSLSRPRGSPVLV